jgi:Zn-dependent protease with chaperone function
MNDDRFESLISRLEAAAQQSPRRYMLTALGVVLLGFVVLGIVMLFALLPAAALVGMVAAVVISGGKAAILLLKLGKLTLLLLIPAWVMIKSSIQMLFTRFPRPKGRALTEAEAPELFARIRDLRQLMHGPQIHHVLLTDELNAAIVQHPRFGLFGWEENYLILGFPLLQAMSAEEALSVVAHEYGHLSGHHSRLGGFIYRFRSAWGRLQSLSEQWTDWGSRLIARLFRWYAPYFNAYTFVLARQNEYVADRISAEVAGQQHAANALMRISIAAQFENDVYWPSIQRMVGEQPQPPAARSQFWVQSIDQHLNEDARLRYLNTARQRQTDHLDTHPALSDRLESIGVQADDAAACALVPPEHSAAQIWLGTSLAGIQQEFDLNWQNDAAERWQEQHQHIEQNRQRLATLQAQASLDTDERWESIQLTQALHPDTDVLPALNELIELLPEHVSALYRRGNLLLARKDEAGIADLECTMTLDIEATLACCEAAWEFYREGNEELAEQYRQCYLARAELEERVRTEFQTLPTNATLEAHQLDADSEAKIRQLIQDNNKYIRRAYLLRRVLKSDPTQHNYVLAFDTQYVTLGDKGDEVTKRLAKLEFPMSTFIIHLGNTSFKAFRKRIKQLGCEPLYSRKA